MIGSGAGYVAGFLFSARMHSRLDKRMNMIIWAVIYAVGPAIPMILGLLGVLQQDTPGLAPILIAFSCLGAAGASILSITVMSALADIADENELTHGLRQEGVLYSTRALAAKVDQAVGAALAGVALMLISFPEKAKPGMVDPGVLHNLALVDGLVGAIPGLVAALCYARYGITRERYEATKAALAARRAAKTA